MTTKFLDDKLCTFKSFIVMVFPTKNSVLDYVSSAPPAQNRKFYFAVVSSSLLVFLGVLHMYRAIFGTHRIGADSRKIRLSQFPGSGLKKI